MLSDIKLPASRHTTTSAQRIRTNEHGRRLCILRTQRQSARVAPPVAAIEAQSWSMWWDPETAPGQEFDLQIAAELKNAAAVLVPVRFDGAQLPIDVRTLGAIITREHPSRLVGANPVVAPVAATADSGRIAICVLPFANLSSDCDQEPFIDGLTEDIVTELSRWRRLLCVRSRAAQTADQPGGLRVRAEGQCLVLGRSGWRG